MLRSIKNRARNLLATGCIFLLLTACANQANLPADAEKALLEYWQSLPSSTEITNEIVRTWMGDTSTAELSEGTEVWCVDARMSAPDPAIDGETLRDKLNRETQLGIDEAVKILTNGS